MKKIIRTISLILILILVFALPAFAKVNYSSYMSSNNYVASNLGVLSNDNTHKILSTRMMDSYNTYNGTYYFYLISDIGNLSVSDVSFSSSFKYSIDSLTLDSSFSTNANFSLRKFCSLTLVSSSDERNLLTIFENSTVYIYKLVVTFKYLKYQPVINTAEFEYDDYYSPFLVDGKNGITYKNQYPLFNSFHVSASGSSYIVYVKADYSFNSAIDIPYLSKSDFDVNNNIYNYFFLGLNNSAFRFFYSNSQFYVNPDNGSSRYPMRISIFYQGSESPIYNYDLYNIAYPPYEDIIFEFSPYLKTETYGLNLLKVSSYLVISSVWNNFSTYVSALGNSNDYAVLALPSDFDFPFYDALYKSTSQSFNNLPTYNFEDGDINIDYSQYYLQKQNWYDFGKDIYNCFIFLIFNIPLLNNVTAPLFMLLNNFIGVWSALVLPLTTVGLVGAFFLFCFIYKTIKKLIGG